MKKLFMTLCAALSLCSCAPEVIPNANKVEGQYSGILQTTSLEDGDIFTDKGVEFSLSTASDGTMTLTMHNTHFVAMMPRLTMNAAGITSLTVGGEQRLSGPEAGIIPTIGDIKYPKYIITNLAGKRIVSAEKDGTGALSLTFNCRGYLVEYVGITK